MGQFKGWLLLLVPDGLDQSPVVGVDQGTEPHTWNWLTARITYAEVKARASERKSVSRGCFLELFLDTSLTLREENNLD